MKKIAVVLSVLMLVACGDDSDNDGPNTPNPNPTQQGALDTPITIEGTCTGLGADSGTSWSIGASLTHKTSCYYYPEYEWESDTFEVVIFSLTDGTTNGLSLTASIANISGPGTYQTTGEIGVDQAYLSITAEPGSADTGTVLLNSTADDTACSVTLGGDAFSASGGDLSVTIDCENLEGIDPELITVSCDLTSATFVVPSCTNL